MVYEAPHGKHHSAVAGGFGHDALVEVRRIAYWKFVTGALFFSACSLLPSLLMG